MTDKLANLPHILWINLDKDKQRKKHMESQFSKYNLANTRIEAIDGENYNDYCHYDKKLTTKNEKGTLGCFLSHIKAMEHFVNTPDLGEYCLIAEDDLSFEYLPFWKKTFWHYIKEAPKDFNIIQLTVTYAYIYLTYCKHLHPRKHSLLKHEDYMYGAGIYLIKREAAEILLMFISKINKKYKLNLIRETVSDAFIYQSLDKVYSIPLFTFNTTFYSNIHSDHIEVIHKPSKNTITKIWKDNL